MHWILKDPSCYFQYFALEWTAENIPTPTAVIAIAPANPTANDMFDISFRFMLSAKSNSAREMTPALYAPTFSWSASVLLARPGKLGLLFISSASDPRREAHAATQKVQHVWNEITICSISVQILPGTNCYSQPTIYNPVPTIHLSDVWTSSHAKLIPIPMRVITISIFGLHVPKSIEVEFMTQHYMINGNWGAITCEASHD
jgi:hypothetical protein